MDINYYLENNYMIWIDTCSILDEFFEKMMNEASNYLMSYMKKIYIAPSVEFELKKHANQNFDFDLNANACNALFLIDKYKKLGIMEKYGNSEKTFADNELLTLFTEMRIEKNLLLITQDEDLSFAIRALGGFNAVSCMKINTAKLGNNGKLIDFEEKKYSSNREKNKEFYNNVIDDFCSIFQDSFTRNIHSNRYVASSEDDIKIVNGDFYGNIKSNMKGVINGNVYGDINGNVKGTINGNVEGDINGNVKGCISGDVKGTINGNVKGCIKGDVKGDIIGNVSGIIFGNVEGEVYGHVTGQIMGKVEKKNKDIRSIFQGVTIQL